LFYFILRNYYLADGQPTFAPALQYVVRTQTVAKKLGKFFGEVLQTLPECYDSKSRNEAHGTLAEGCLIWSGLRKLA